MTCRVGTVTDVFGEGAFAVSTKDPSHKYENRLTAFTKEGVSYYGPYIAINGTKHVMRSYNQAMAFHELVEALEPMRRILRNMAEGMNRVSEIATLFSSKHQGKTNAK